MSKQSKAKQCQGYIEKPVPRTCANCSHFESDLILPSWMEESNNDGIENGQGARYGDKDKIQKNLRCKIGGFAVKKTATCRQYKE